MCVLTRVSINVFKIKQNFNAKDQKNDHLKNLSPLVMPLSKLCRNDVFPKAKKKDGAEFETLKRDSTLRLEEITDFQLSIFLDPSYSEDEKR